MDKNVNVTMDRRFSLNMTHLPNPIAESTCVNLNGTTKCTTGGKNIATNQFRWGGSPISPKNHSKSSICLSKTNSAHKCRSTTTSPQRARMNLSKIDPRIYADVQSRGLVSRIVQYHENGSRLNRSMSASNLYCKSGPTSIGQLQKTELPYRATQQNVSMTRIAPPKKSVFYGNTLSSLLRSNSVISLTKSDEEISCENQPILHPPPTENDLAPTRSVLDVLKEISRKRINSDDTDNIHDANKKYCSRECNVAPYEHSMHNAADPRSMAMHGGLIKPTLSAPVQSYKRQREQIVASQPHPLQYASNGVTSGHTVNSTQSIMETQRSPEQIAKKRLCNYNNDITSSLSSSLIHANKRKFYEQQRSTIQKLSPSKVEEYETQKSKIQRQQSDLRFQQLTKNLSCNTPITPIPTTPLTQSDTMPAMPYSTENTSEDSATVAGVIKRTVSEPPISYAETSSKPQKPKITLFNRDYNQPTNSIASMNGSDESIEENNKDLDDGECADIQFVKPKMSFALVNKNNPLIARTQKSKLAMMLSGLRGEIYQGDDEVDKISNKMTRSSANNITSNDKSAGKVAMTASSTTATTTTGTISSNFIMKAPDKSFTTPPRAVISTAPGSHSSTDKATAASSTTAVASSTSATATSTPTTTLTSSTLAGFKLTSAITTSNTTTSNASPSQTTSQATVVKATSPLVGLKLTPQKPTINFGDKTSTAAPTINFAATAAASTESNKSFDGSIATGVGAVPQLLGFSFGSTTKTTSSASTTGTATLATAAAATTNVVTTAGNIGGGFKFGPTQKLEVLTAAPTVTQSTATAAVPSFASFTNTIASTSTSASTEAAKPIFAFGSAASAATVSPAAAVKPTFSFGGGAMPAGTTTAPTFGNVSSSTFTFGGTTNPSTAPTTSTFSAVSQTSATATQQPTNLFSSGPSNSAFTLPKTSTSTPFAFGASSPTTQAATTTTATFSFGGAVTATANPAASATATATASGNPFPFGSQKPNVAPAATTTTTTATVKSAVPFAFGSATQQPNSTPAPMSSVNTTKPVFSFGAPVENAAANPLGGPIKPSSTTTGNLFAFGGSTTANENKIFGSGANNSNTQTAVVTSTQSNAFTFGAAAAAPAVQGTTPTFGVASGAASTTAFGVTSTSSKTPFAFGANSANTSAPAPSAVPANSSSATGGFSFGAAAMGTANGGNATTSNIFGSASTTALSNQSAPTLNTGVAKSAFNFGDSTKSIFGSNVTNTGTNAASNNTFGTLAAANSSQNNNTFSFGAAASKPAAGGFSFAANTTINKPTVAAPAVAANSTTPFAFGAASSGAAGASTTTTTPFNFGSTNGGVTANKTFNFGSSSNAPAPAPSAAATASNIFGGGVQGAAGTQQSSVSPFNFSAGPSAAPAATNLFAPPAPSGGVGGGSGGGGGGGGGEGERRIRRATRRLQKT